MDNGCCEKIEKFCFEGVCPSKASETANVTVPVAVRTSVDVGNVEFKCLGASVITRNSDRTPGSACKCGLSEFTISQRMRVDIPVKFGLEVDVGEGHVDFENEGDCDGPFCGN